MRLRERVRQELSFFLRQPRDGVLVQVIQKFFRSPGGLHWLDPCPLGQCEAILFTHTVKPIPHVGIQLTGETGVQSLQLHHRCGARDQHGPRQGTFRPIVDILQGSFLFLGVGNRKIQLVLLTKLRQSYLSWGKSLLLQKNRVTDLSVEIVAYCNAVRVEKFAVYADVMKNLY